MNKKIFTALISVVLMAGAVCADPNWSGGQEYNAYDAGPALRVLYSGRSACSFAVTGDSATITVTVDVGLSTEAANSLDCSGAAIDTIAELAAAINAVTNTAGKKLLEADSGCVASTGETMDDELLVSTVTKHGPGWVDAFLWDTSDTKHYRVYIPPSGKGSHRNLARALSVYGDVKGTGDITIKCYSDNTEIYTTFIESPVYIYTSPTVVDTNTVVAGIIDIPLDLVVGKDKGLLISCDRASSGTTGGVGLRFENQ